MSTTFTPLGRVLRALLGRRGATIVHVHPGQARRDLALVRETRAQGPLLIGDVAALELLACVRAARRMPGVMAELGVYAGGTARLICEAKGDRPLHLFDVFETLQGPSLQSPPLAPEIAADVRSLFRQWHRPRAAAEELLAPYPGVSFHPGVFPTTAGPVASERFSFVHLDADLESSTREGLGFFHPRLLPGGVLIGDDYNLPGVRRAFDQYFQGRPDPVVALPWGQAVVVKVS